MKLEIIDLKAGLVNGVQVMLPEDGPVYQDDFFEWQATTLVAEFQTARIGGGVLKAWHHQPKFQVIEYHEDREMFYFAGGTAIMLFIDIRGGAPVLESAQLVRIKPGTQIIIDAGKGHFVAVAQDDQPVQAVVVAPVMDAPRLDLSEVISGEA